MKISILSPEALRSGRNGNDRSLKVLLGAYVAVISLTAIISTLTLYV